MRIGMLTLAVCALCISPLTAAPPKAKAKAKAEKAEAKAEAKEKEGEQAAIKLVRELGGTVEHVDGDVENPVAAVVLSGAKLTPAQIRQLAQFKGLRTLILREGPFDNAALAQLAVLENLQALDLEYTSVSDAGLPALQKLPSIREVYLTGSGVTPKGVEAIRNLMPTTQIFWLEPLPKLQTADQYFKLGEELNTKNERVQAIRSYTEAMKLDPKLSAAYLSRGWTLMKEDEHQLAKADFAEFVKQQPKSAVGIGGLALAQYLLGEAKEALANAEKSLKLDKNCADAMYVRGMIRFDNEEFEQALPDFENAVKLEPQDAANHERLGWTYLELKKYEEALTSFDVALQLDKQFEHAYYGRGLYWMAKHNPAKAAEDFTKALQLDETFPDYAVDLALAQATKGDWTAAVTTQRKVLTLASEEDQEEQQRRLKYYQSKQLPPDTQEVESAAKPGLEKK